MKPLKMVKVLLIVSSLLKRKNTGKEELSLSFPKAKESDRGAHLFPFREERSRFAPDQSTKEMRFSAPFRQKLHRKCGEDSSVPEKEEDLSLFFPEQSKEEGLLFTFIQENNLRQKPLAKRKRRAPLFDVVKERRAPCFTFLTLSANWTNFLKSCLFRLSKGLS
jgi:hypothetical protein